MSARVRLNSATCAWISSVERKPPNRPGSVPERSLVENETSASSSAGPGSGGGASVGLASSAISFRGLNSGTRSSLPAGASARVVETRVNSSWRMICLSPTLTVVGALKCCFSATMSARRISRSPLTSPLSADLPPRAGATSSGGWAMVDCPFVATMVVMPMRPAPAIPVRTTADNQRIGMERRSWGWGMRPLSVIGGSVPRSAGVKAPYRWSALIVAPKTSSPRRGARISPRHSLDFAAQLRRRMVLSSSLSSAWLTRFPQPMTSATRRSASRVPRRVPGGCTADGVTRPEQRA